MRPTVAPLIIPCTSTHEPIGKLTPRIIVVVTCIQNCTLARSSYHIFFFVQGVIPDASQWRKSASSWYLHVCKKSGAFLRMLVSDQATGIVQLCNKHKQVMFIGFFCTKTSVRSPRELFIFMIYIGKFLDQSTQRIFFAWFWIQKYWL